jgi:DNA-binding response OmpR family regulator
VIPAPRVLVVDDERPFADAVAEFLNDHGFRAEAAYDGMNAVAAARRERPDALVTDIRMPARNGFDVADAVRRESPRCAIVLMTAHAEMSAAWLATGIHADGFVRKPASLAALAATVESAIEDRRRRNG